MDSASSPTYWEVWLLAVVVVAFIGILNGTSERTTTNQSGRSVPFRVGDPYDIREDGPDSRLESLETGF